MRPPHAPRRVISALASVLLVLGIAQVERQLILRWPTAVDDTSVTGYIIRRGTTAIASVEASVRTLEVGGLLPNTAYGFSVNAIDQAGNVSTDGPEVSVTTAPDFIDVADLNIFHDDVAWLAGEGITRGCNPPVNDRFCPDDPVTRGQMAAFLVRALDLTDAGGADFVDDNGSVFEGDIERLAAAGITRGCNPPVNDTGSDGRIPQAGSRLMEQRGQHDEANVPATDLVVPRVAAACCG